MHLSLKELEDGLDFIKQSPKENGKVEHIVCRPEVGTRRDLEAGELDLKLGLVGDNWKTRGNRKTPDGAAHPDTQLNLMNSRVIELIAKTRDRWKLAGDQLYVDLDLSPDNLPPGTELAIGDAIIQVTAEPHLGCKKFMERYGKDATVFVNSKQGKAINLRGVNAKVIKPGHVRTGDVIRKIGLGDSGN
ncbi:MOSC domain-containing protein [Hahella ganghwensis]|uniref:MOSC domain-containing protein n=1 Tax=Hahella ganghwensis TaxID=286420 RepID=UPI0003748FF8|nr:MOSC domain-containing protein [Hahella ganghwensis]